MTNTPGAVRAAQEILATYHVLWPAPLTDLYAAIIDKETGTPELLAACKEAYDMVCNCPGNWPQGVCKILATAISNAKGVANGK